MILPGVFSPALLAAGGGSTETALTVTVIIMLIALAAVFFAVLVPEEDRVRISRAISGMKRYIVPGKGQDVVEFDHDYDGIRELDNRIPPWFSYLFAGTIVFGGIYMVDYHVLGTSKLMEDEYREEVSAATLQRRILLALEGTIDENTLAALTDVESLKRGGEQFQKYCVSCHGVQAQGVVGPNLTDRYWIHGAGIRNVYQTVKMGAPAKGMISWQLVFTPKQMQEIASYVLSLQGTNPPNGKAPEGQLFAAQDSTATGL
jgi:cytochrome c oxidase cbb3-type subunit III